ncbi:Os08g0106100 [Oryza sativa Japonica Group]|uniref:Os08g0106100 protein n=2 Tax=Oryza sativa subsp. japonica TaxID=39947 RepID=A0A0P0XAZ5_ORYSJ|nr:hypothetical protein OsJ_25754 [Oryza sativa Japonica Group]KAF2917731.1 hypothetical protein DAI22_08g004500 [Oryza sativa Japonica Group]BAF22704.1 Os08g0106100 [Oryza sativa Japonica Group]BAT03453.1 Os08g0106100 [Oryza sativa Japonica Group]|eukprot:NP_001060790.1 Os08g0106100 [Oryza sativa Japonica Group]
MRLRPPAVVLLGPPVIPPSPLARSGEQSSYVSSSSTGVAAGMTRKGKIWPPLQSSSWLGGTRSGLSEVGGNQIRVLLLLLHRVATSKS